jgi:hypothetical protein
MLRVHRQNRKHMLHTTKSGYSRIPLLPSESSTGNVTALAMLSTLQCKLCFTKSSTDQRGWATLELCALGDELCHFPKSHKRDDVCTSFYTETGSIYVSATLDTTF